jgi:hypothetical protein
VGKRSQSEFEVSWDVAYFPSMTWPVESSGLLL